MELCVPAWESRLVHMARQALDSHAGPAPVLAAQDDLARAHAWCDMLTQRHSRTFYLASGLLPAEKRQAVRALYAFCRVSDDLVDMGGPDALANLEDWRRRSLGGSPAADDLVALAWADARSRYQIPEVYAQQLIDGVAADLCTTRYASFDELTTYCYGVASTVGLMSMHITGFAGVQALPYAVRLGVALQLTNILRDVGEDWRAGRLYLPQDELAHYGLTEAAIAVGATDARWQRFLSFQIARTRQLYRQALPGVALLHADGRLAIAAAAELYCAILGDIEEHAGDVFRRRAHVSGWGKLRRLPGIWWRARTSAYSRLAGENEAC